jgi:Domain of unknown function (DUF4352)
VKAGYAAAPVLIGALLAGACGGSSGVPATRTATHAVHRRPAGAGLRLGQAYEVTAGGSFLSVTVTKVIDPLTDSGATLLSGMRAIGVKIKVLNHGPDTYDSSATGDVSLVVSSGVAVPTFAPSGACQTPLRDFDNDISPGQTASGCVTFSAPNGAKVLEVRFAPHANKAAAARYRWSVG